MTEPHAKIVWHDAGFKIAELLKGGHPSLLEADHYEDEVEKEFAGLVNRLLTSVGDMQNAVAELSKGELDKFACDKSNVLAFSLRELHAKLRHLTWQAERIAEGDYQQRVDFMGDFSKAFNAMVAKLAQREEQLFQIQKNLEDLVQERTAELESAKIAAEAANKAKGVFLMNMSHELRTPLNGILTASALLPDCDAKDELIEIQEIIESSSNALLVTIERILDYTRAEDGELALASLPFRLTEVLMGLKTRFFHKGEYLDLTLDIDRHEAVPDALIGDGQRLAAVLNQLLENAAKFSANAPAALVAIEVADQNSEEVQLRFTVKDNGIGIAPQYRERVFEPFFQADTSITRQYDGVGVGLSLCRQYVRLMGGEIQVADEAGEGSRLVFTARFKRA